MRCVAFALAMLVAALPAAARSQTSPVVLELYTSQGCSSCPPADALLTDLAKQPGVIALAMHVDYWDYLGWADDFALPGNEARQRGYAKQARLRSIFTPQMVVQGQDILIGHRAGEIMASIAAHQAQPDPVALEIARDAGLLNIHLAPAGDPVGPAVVQVVTFVPEIPVSIERGENAGKRITYSHIVTDWSTIARWDGASEAEIAIDDPGDPVAVIVQGERLGPILTAASLP